MGRRKHTRSRSSAGRDEEESSDRREPRRSQRARAKQSQPKPYRQSTPVDDEQPEIPCRTSPAAATDSEDPTYTTPPGPTPHRDISEETETGIEQDGLERRTTGQLYQCSFSSNRPGRAPCTVLGNGRKAAKSVRTPNELDLTCR